MKLKQAVVLATALSLAPISAFAAKKAAPAAPKAVIPTLDAVLGASGINVSGAVDMSYDVSKNDGAVAGASANYRQFDVHPNSFVFHQLNLTISKQWSNGLSLVVNPVFGEDANVLNAADTRAGAVGADTSDFNLTQAYLAYTLGDFTLQGGKFVTLAGSEVINPAGNINASRSFLFTNFQPLTHVGVRGTYQICKGLTVTAGGLNSGAAPTAVVAGLAGNAKTDNNSGIALEGQIAYTGGMFSSAFTFYTGDAGTAGGAPAGTLGADNREATLYDLVVSVTPMDALTLGLNADYRVTDANGIAAAGNQTYDSGIAGYVNFKLTPKARIALRGEYVSIDSNVAHGGAGGEEFVFGNEITATFGYSPLSGLELIAEMRHDDLSGVQPVAGAPAYFFAPISPGGRNSYYQQTGTLKAVYRF